MESILNRTAFPGDYLSERERALEDSKLDQALIERVAGGDQQALAELYLRYSGPLMNYLVRMVGRPQTAEDLLQEVFMVVWQKAGGFQGRSSFKTWIFRIAHNKSISWLRKKKTVVELEEDTLDRRESTEYQSELSWQSDQINLAVAKLSDKQRVAVELIFIYDFSYREAAKVIGCPEGTVKSRVNHALRRLNGLLLQQGIGDTRTSDN